VCLRSTSLQLLKDASGKCSNVATLEGPWLVNALAVHQLKRCPATARAKLPPFRLIHGEADRSVPLSIASEFAKMLQVSLHCCQVGRFMQEPPNQNTCQAGKPCCSLSEGAGYTSDAGCVQREVTHRADDRRLSSRRPRSHARADTGGGAEPAFACPLARRSDHAIRDTDTFPIS